MLCFVLFFKMDGEEGYCNVIWDICSDCLEFWGKFYFGEVFGICVFMRF